MAARLRRSAPTGAGVVVGSALYSSLLEILLEPGLVVEALAVDGLDLRAQDAPLGGGVRAEVGRLHQARLPPAQIARLYRLVLRGLGLADEVEVGALGLVQKRVGEARVRLVPLFVAQERLDSRSLKTRPSRPKTMPRSILQSHSDILNCARSSFASRSLQPSASRKSSPAPRRPTRTRRRARRRPDSVCVSLV